MELVKCFSKKAYVVAFILIIIFSCTETDFPDDIEIVKIFVSDTLGLPANGTFVPIKAYISQDATSEKSKITFYCTDGIFKTSDEKQVTVDAILEEEFEDAVKKYATAYIKSPTSPKNVQIFAQILSYKSKKVNLNFVDAPVVDISLEVDKFGILNDFTEEVLITCSLKSEEGIPSVGKKVLLEFINMNAGLEFSDIRLRNSSLTSNDKGIVSVYFNGGNLNYTGTVKIVARVEDTTLSDSTYVELY